VSSPAPADDAHGTSSSEGPRISLGLISDDHSMRGMWRHQLQRDPNLALAWDIPPTGAIDELLTTRPVQVVVVDDGPRPQMLAMVRHIRGTLPHMPVIVLAEKVTDEFLFTAHGTGAVACARRNAGVGQLAPTVRAVLHLNEAENGRFTRGPLFGALSPREAEVLSAMRIGRTNAEIARNLNISRATVDRHVHEILQKLGVRNRVEAANLAVTASVSMPTSIAWQVLRLDDVCRMVTSRALHVFAATAGIIGVWNPERSQLSIFFDNGRAFEVRFAGREEGILGRAFSSGSFVTADLMQAGLTPPLWAWERTGRAAMAVPLEAPEGRIGALAVLTATYRDFTSSELRILESLAAETVSLLRLGALV
jgi:DNA-binding NarL/FixJ family response regulator